MSEDDDMTRGNRVVRVGSDDAHSACAGLGWRWQHTHTATRTPPVPSRPLYIHASIIPSLTMDRFSRNSLSSFWMRSSCRSSKASRACEDRRSSAGWVTGGRSATNAGRCACVTRHVPLSFTPPHRHRRSPACAPPHSTPPLTPLACMCPRSAVKYWSSASSRSRSSIWITASRRSISLSWP